MVAFHGGIDPRNARSSSITLRQALELYLNVRQTLKPRSREEFRAVIDRHLSAWLDIPLRSIDRDMVEQRLRSIAEEVEQHDRTVSLEAARRHRARAERVEEHWPEAAERHRAKFKAASERKPYSGYATANLAMRALRAIWNFMAERTSDLPPNPVKLRRQWHSVQPRERVLRADDLPKFYKARHATAEHGGPRLHPIDAVHRAAAARGSIAAVERRGLSRPDPPRPDDQIGSPSQAANF